MARVGLVCWNEAEAKARAEKLAQAGYEPDWLGPAGGISMKRWRQNPPLAFLIDLDRLPSHGREVGMALRQTKATRHVPLIFAGGVDEKVAAIREVLPDATYTTWGRVRSALSKAKTPVCPVVPAPYMDRFAGTPLPKKLGIKEGTRVGLYNTPRNFEKTLGVLPEGACLVEAEEACDLLIWFVLSRAELNGLLAAHAALVPLWIAYPKQQAKVRSDLTQQTVREMGLAAGIVDYKVCAIDTTWTGLLFSRRKK